MAHYALERGKDREGFTVGVGLARAAHAAALLAHDRVGEAEEEARSAVWLTLSVPVFAVRAFTTLVRARLAKGRIMAALRASRAGIALVDSPRSIGATEAGMRLVRAEALYAAGDIDGARSAIDDARHRILARAARCPDAMARQRYLERVPSVARTLALAEQWAPESSEPSSTSMASPSGYLEHKIAK